jgi:hypothetical protein
MYFKNKKNQIIKKINICLNINKNYLKSQNNKLKKKFRKFNKIN